jgi:hypothetical protein
MRKFHVATIPDKHKDPIANAFKAMRAASDASVQAALKYEDAINLVARLVAPKEVKEYNVVYRNNFNIGRRYEPSVSGDGNYLVFELIG